MHYSEVFTTACSCVLKLPELDTSIVLRKWTKTMHSSLNKLHLTALLLMPGCVSWRHHCWKCISPNVFVPVHFYFTHVETVETGNQEGKEMAIYYKVLHCN